MVAQLKSVPAGFLDHNAHFTLIYWLKLVAQRFTITSWHDTTLVPSLLHQRFDDFPLQWLYSKILILEF